ncbi:MAG: hypothetical protein HGA31_05355 [Candidatus Moranbacteria bacterium]|nr:hypothetical protein [Candidatus Moranbacteria bacterium]
MAKDHCIYHRQHARKKVLSFSGAIHPAALVALFVFFLSGIGYVYAMNRGAIQGYRERELDTEISELRKEGKKLQLSLAEQQSLSRVEATAKDRQMEQAVNVKVIGERSSLALR